MSSHTAESTLVAEAGAPRPTCVVPSREPSAAASVCVPGRARWKPVAAALLLLVIYGALSLALDSGGEVADVGGKLATLDVMANRGSLRPDVGYWAEQSDPDGALHPLAFTEHVGDRWVQVTTLPMLYAAYPIYLVGGAHAAVLFAMLGGVACAFAARALGRRLGGDNGWLAFWVVGLATPVFVYSLSFWEHTMGLALMAWASIGLFDITQRRAGARVAALAGCGFGLAATMRTEAFVYAAVIVAITVMHLVWAGRLRAAAASGAAAAVGFVAIIATNQVIESIVIGNSTRSGRVTGTAARAARDLSTRLDLATTSFSGVNGFQPGIDWLVGAAMVALIVGGALLVRSPSRRVIGFGLVTLAATLGALRLVNGVGFVPGLLTASPIVAAGLCLTWRRADLRVIGLFACVPIPFVWMTQYADTMRPQWGARYLFTSGLLLAVVAVVVLRPWRPALITLIASGVVVTLIGVSFVIVRSHAIADGAGAVLGRPGGIISMDQHLFRETGDRYDPTAHWLTATDAPSLRRAATIIRGAGDRKLTVIAKPGDAPPERLGDFERVGPSLIEPNRPGEQMQVVEYHVP